ncbi:DJ-1/PfpI family protein [Methylocaldum sp. MU1018]
MNRRHFFTKFACLSGCLAPFMAIAESPTGREARKNRGMEVSRKAHEAVTAAEGFKMHGSERIAMLIYPGFTALDLAGPQYMLASMMGAKIYLISSTNDLAPVKSDTGLSVVPTHTQAECPDALDILFVPGSAVGLAKAMKDAKFIEFIRTQAAVSKYVTSVCTGSMLLGKAGLLRGKKATSHWVTLDLLPKFGATPVKERVVWDGNLITGGGVTAGIDFGLQIIAALRGRLYAEAIQLQSEYDPRPPYDSGSPDKADVFVKDNLRGMFERLRTDIELEI